MGIKTCISFLCLMVLYTSCHAEVISGSIVIKEGKMSFDSSIKKDAIAYGLFNDSIESTGWGVLDLTAKTNKGKYSGQQVMYAAGMLEGILTHKRIDQNYKNMVSFVNTSPELLEKVCKFFSTQEGWLRSQVKKEMGNPIWQHAGYVQAQMDGLIDGFNLFNKSSGRCPMQILTGIGDLIDLRYALEPSLFPDLSSMTTDQLTAFVQSNGHCSAIIKILPGFEDLFMGHSSWFIYNAMLRIYKNYNLQVYDKEVPNGKMSFSSYPGYLVSLDDFYILGSGMVMLQTTNNIFNKTLYDIVNPASLFAWQRVRIANALAENGRQWGDILSRYNSGTYNNQYMIIDLKKFTPDRALEDGALYVVEQIPGYVEYADQTNILRAGYWPSYNVPFYERIYNMSGYLEMAKRDVDYTYQLAPRAKIFRRDQATVTSLQGIKDILRSNDYRNDKYSEGDPCNAICCRGDLKPNAVTDGCYDTKVTSFKMALQFKSDIISGPTVGSKNVLPPFSWSKFVNVSHIGMPDTFNFDFIPMEPKF